MTIINFVSDYIIAAVSLIGPPEEDIVTSHHCHERREKEREEQRAGALPGAAPARGQGPVHICLDRRHRGESAQQNKDRQLHTQDTERWE